MVLCRSWMVGFIEKLKSGICSMDMMSSNQASISIVKGDVYVGDTTQSLVPITGNYQLSSSNTIWANPNARYVISSSSETQTVDVDCITCVTINADNNPTVTQVDPTVAIHLNDLQNTQFSASDLAIIQAHTSTLTDNQKEEKPAENDSNQAPEEDKAQSQVIGSEETASSGFVEVVYDDAQILATAGHDSYGYNNQDRFLDDDDSIPVLNAGGGGSVSMSLTEGDLQPLGYSNQGYPVSIQSSILVKAGTLPLQADTFYIPIRFFRYFIN